MIAARIVPANFMILLGPVCFGIAAPSSLGRVLFMLRRILIKRNLCYFLGAFSGCTHCANGLQIHAASGLVLEIVHVAVDPLAHF